jgi:hypothetical protein
MSRWLSRRVFCFVPRTSRLIMKRQIYAPFPSECSLVRLEPSEAVRQRMSRMPTMAFEAETTCFEDVDWCESSYGKFPTARSRRVRCSAWLGGTSWLLRLIKILACFRCGLELFLHCVNQVQPFLWSKCNANPRLVIPLALVEHRDAQRKPVKFRSAKFGVDVPIEVQADGLPIRILLWQFTYPLYWLCFIRRECCAA